MYLVISIDNISKEEWGRFVYEHPNGNVFQTPEMYEVYKNTKNYEPVFIGVTDNSGEIVGILLSVIQREFGGPLGILSSRCVTWGGPLIKDSLLTNEKNEVLSLILKKLNDIIKRKALYMEFRNLWDTSLCRNIFEKNQFMYEDHLDILIDLTKGKDYLWKNMKKSRRREIRSAEKLGLKFDEYPFHKLLDDFYKPLKIMYNSKGLPLPDISYVENIRRFLCKKDLARLFYVQLNNKILASQIVLTYKNMIYALYGASTDEGKNIHANAFRYWRVMVWGREKGYKILDLGGAGKPNEPYGPRDFKMRFGGVIVNYGRYKNIYNSILYGVAMKGLNLWKKVRKGGIK